MTTNGATRAGATCVLCGGRRFRPVYRPPDTGGRQLERCERCTLVQMNPLPSVAELDAYYQRYDVLGEREPYFQAAWGPDALRTPEGRELVHRARWLLRHAPAPGHLLDVGSGPGMFLRLMKARGVAVEGVELNRRAAERCAALFGVPVHAGTLETLPAGQYEAITLWDLVEHVNDPPALLRRVHALLAPGGWLFLETPDEAALLDRSVLLLARLGLRWPANQFYGLHHIVLFRPATIRRLLATSGFVVRDLRGAATTIERVFRGDSPRERAARLALRALFAAGRLVGRENKLLVAAQRSD